MGSVSSRLKCINASEDTLAACDWSNSANQVVEVAREGRCEVVSKMSSSRVLRIDRS